MPELQELVANRGRVKTRLTKFSTFVQRCVTEPEKRAELPHKLEKLNDAWYDFGKVQDAIESIDSSEDQIKERDDFEGSYHHIVTKARLLCPQFNMPTAMATTAQTLRSDNVDIQNSVKLPIIDLPKFDGNLEQWLSFRDLFQSLIDSNRALSNIQKLHYLRSALTGAAAKVAQSLDITSDNYEITWNLVKERFENKKLIIQHHVQALLNLNHPARESHSALRQFIFVNTSKRLKG